MSTASASGAPAAAPVPVSAARAEREAIATAATAGALRRRNQGTDPAQLARRIAAALNAGVHDFGFYWVTAVTGDDSIIVANSYGIAYIPEGVLLPENVRMASADESISAAERGRWATYPILAVQGWAQHHDLQLRCVIATEDQFQGFDPGAPKVILQPDDIPDDGSMQGRTRLEVIAPDAAAKLARTSDNSLMELLPPPQVGGAPEDNELAIAWFEVTKPLMSRSPNRIGAHLKAMASYAAKAMDAALLTAQSEADLSSQRAAIADWVYWQHQGSLVTEALEGAAAR